MNKPDLKQAKDFIDQTINQASQALKGGQPMTNSNKLTELLSYDITDHTTKRSFQEEWAPHARQTKESFEWWYMTASVHDAQGNPYFVYVGVPDHVGDIMQTRLMGETFPEELRTAAVTVTLSDYNNNLVMSPATVAVMPGLEMFDTEKNALVLADGQGMTLYWDYQGDNMTINYAGPKFNFDFKLTNVSDGLWHKDKLGTEGLIQQGDENARSFYYSLTNAGLQGKISLKDGEGNITRVKEVFGRAWVDRQWGDFTNNYWEWSSYRFENGATMHLYNFYNGHQEGLYRDVEGNVQYFDNVVIKQNGYCKAPNAKTWQSWGWSYEFPIEIEGSKNFTVKPYSDKEFLEFPHMQVEFEGAILNGFAIYEGLGALINDETGEVVGVSVNESIDIRAMKNYPYGPRQK